MTPDELDSAIRQELRSAARLAPDPGPVRVRVLRAAEAMAAQELPRRGLRAWTVPLLAAAAVLVALVLTATTEVLRSEGRNGPAGSPTPPAVSVSASPVSPTPTAPASTAGARSASSPGASTTPGSTPTRGGEASNPARTSSGSGSGSRPVAQPAPQDWYRGLHVAALPHTAGLCPDGLAVDHVDGMGAPTISVAGEPAPLWLVPVTCRGATDAAHPAPVEVYGYTPAGPRLVQTLAFQDGDPRSIVVTVLTVGPGSVTLGESGYDPEREQPCCRSLRFVQTYSWDGGHFVPGPRQDAVAPCTDDQLTISGSYQHSQDQAAEGILLVYANHTDQPCELTGYPGAAVSDAADPTPADAVRTPTGPLGGLSPGSEPSRVVLLGSMTGSAVVEWGTDQQAASRCWTQATVAPTRPGGLSATAPFENQALVCDPQVHPVVYGDTGRQTTG